MPGQHRNHNRRYPQPVRFSPEVLQALSQEAVTEVLDRFHRGERGRIEGDMQQAGKAVIACLRIGTAVLFFLRGIDGIDVELGD